MLYIIAYGSEQNVTTNGGFAVHLGYGSMYGEYGLGGEYQFVLKQKLRLTPSFGFGFHTIFGNWLFGYSIGCDIEIGNDHRLIIGPRFGTFSEGSKAEYNSDSIVVNYNTAHGPSLEAGYKGEAFFGLLWFVRGGIRIMINSRIVPEFFTGPVFSTGLGWKF